jgi:aminodeoxyfutalosine deaminase
MLAFRARYVFPIDTPPLRDGVVAIDHDRIVAIGEGSSPEIHDLLPAARDLGDVAILPGLINSHTHLELSNLHQIGSPGMAFPDWIRLVVDHQRRQRQISTGGEGAPRAAENLTKSLAAGIEQTSWSAVTTLGDIESGINSPIRSARPQFLREHSPPFELVNFLEVIALKEKSVADAIGYLSAAVDYHYGERSNFKLGISPHAPYTVHPELLRRCVQLSVERKLPVAHHLAESREELMLLRAGCGPFVKLLQDFDAWDPNAIPFGTQPLDYLTALASAHRALIIHGNYLNDDEIGFVGAHSDGMSIVYCPRTHAYFQHDPYPLAKMIAAGVNVAIGTDSRASNPDLSVLADMRFAAKQHPLVSPATVLRMITANAAKALGRDDEIGTITPGKFADLAIMQLPRHDADDPHELLFDTDCCITATVFRGGVVHGQLAP